MEDLRITIDSGTGAMTFDVKDYIHHQHEGKCKYELFRDGIFVLSLEPDGPHILRTCVNPGILDEELIHRIIDKMEGLNI